MNANKGANNSVFERVAVSSTFYSVQCIVDMYNNEIYRVPWSSKHQSILFLVFITSGQYVIM